MKMNDISTFASQLYADRGADAIAYAAQKARALEEADEADEAQTWRKIERALLEMRGPRQG